MAPEGTPILTFPGCVEALAPSCLSWSRVLGIPESEFLGASPKSGFRPHFRDVEAWFCQAPEGCVLLRDAR